MWGFNTQPPEGGWQQGQNQANRQNEFQHTAARRRLETMPTELTKIQLFQHTAARRRLEPLSKTLLHQVSQPRFR